jgi:hypothetical protein
MFQPGIEVNSPVPWPDESVTNRNILRSSSNRGASSHCQISPVLGKDFYEMKDEAGLDSYLRGGFAEALAILTLRLDAS